MFWFVLAVIGQWTFAFYIVAFYGGAAAEGDLARWSKSGITHAYIPGDTLGNIALSLHLLLAAILTLGGPLQLIPQIRSRLPGFHRWLGRSYILVAFVASLSALYLLWVRGSVGDIVQHIGTSLNALVIMACAIMALRYALARKFVIHRRWALRLFLAVSGVWFFRVGLMFWILVNQGPVGFDPKTFQGPFLSLLSFAQYLLPLAVLQLYLHTQQRAGASGRLAMATLLVVLTLAMGVGIFGAFMGMWLPALTAA